MSVKKRGNIGVKVLFTVVVVVICALVIFLIFFNDLAPGLRASITDNICAMSTTASSFGKVAGIEFIEQQCPIEHVTISSGDLGFDKATKKEYFNLFFKGSKEVKIEKSDIGDVGDQSDIGDLTGGDKFKLTEAELTPEQIIKANQILSGVTFAPQGNKYKKKDKNQMKANARFKLNRLVGKELTSCWDSMGRGELNLFSSWYDPVTDDSNKITSDDGILSSMWKFAKKGYKAGTGDLKQPPTICIICSRIRFDLEGDLQNYISSALSQKTDLMAYLMATPHPYMKRLDGTAMSKYEFLLDDEAKSMSSVVYLPSFGFQTNQRMNVVFARINTFEIGKWVSKIGGWAGLVPEDESKAQGIDFLFIGNDDTVLERCGVIANA
jgi:hypothetical protein